jgi:hypothetical protein
MYYVHFNQHTLMTVKQLLFLALAIVLFSCEQRNKYPYAIKDFRKTLQPYLTNIVTKGIVDWDSSLHNMATDEELSRLSKCEHPLLRAVALREMLDRKSFNHFNILMNHLDDTATVPVEGGEFGIRYRTVSDYMLQEAKWKDSAAKNKTIDEVITRHNYLQSAYKILTEVNPQEKYYSFIKNMATRPRKLYQEEYELGFDDIEYALYGLAKFKKKEDIRIIEEKLMQNVPKLTDVSFRLMREFRDTAYFNVFQTYHRRVFYHLCGNNYYYSSRPIDFIDALIVYQDERSAKIFDTILHRLPLVKCGFDKAYIEEHLITSLWEHPCPAFAPLNKKVRKKAEAYEKNNITVDPITVEKLPADTTTENIRW